LDFGPGRRISEVDATRSPLIINLHPDVISFTDDSVTIDMGYALNPTDNVLWMRGAFMDLQFVTTSVPEPASLALLALALAGLRIVRRRKA
jgi:hypothetical protein